MPKFVKPRVSALGPLFLRQCGSVQVPVLYYSIGQLGTGLSQPFPAWLEPGDLGFFDSASTYLRDQQVRQLAGTWSLIVDRGMKHLVRQFFAGVGTGYAAGVWEQAPRDRPEFRQQYRKQLAKLAAVRSTAEDGI